MKQKGLLCLAGLMLPGLLLAHPHFGKTITAELNGRTLKLHFTTYPYNESHLAEVTEGFVFHCGRATLTVEGTVGANGQSVPAGEYLVRAQAESVDEWTLFLIPASAGSTELDLSKAIRLQTSTVTGLPVSHHLDLDLYSGHDATEGKLILAVSFGERKVEGVLDLT